MLFIAYLSGIMFGWWVRCVVAFRLPSYLVLLGIPGLIVW